MLSVPHLDREFDYLVAAEQSDDAQPGVRVRVRFHGRLVDAFILERRSETDHVGKLGWLDRVVSAERVLTPDVRRLVDAVAARYAGTRADVLRLAIPPRHANVEKETPAEPAPVDRRSRSTPRGGPNTAGANSFSPHFARAAPPARSGRRCRASAGPTGWPRPRRPPSTPGAGCWRSCPTSATSTRCTTPASGSSTRAGWSRFRRGSAPRSATGAGCRCCGVRRGWSSGRAARCSLRSPISGW